MGANITIYCLEQLTDYFQFERLCNDLMALEGYKSIEPLGGYHDKGRDAINVNHSNLTTIFAYSVREDWRAKLSEDANKIYKHGHPCDEINFLTTADFTAGERDEAIEYINTSFGWKLNLYGRERLRILLETTHPHVKINHPQIFPPAFIQIKEEEKPDSKRNHLLINFSPEDSAFADWLARRLTAEGYLVWSELFNIPGEEPYPDDIYKAIENRVFKVLGLYCTSSGPLGQIC